ncbi:MAG: type II CRISPR-associated endonuclease Cas1 [Acidimicrobiales bacterium]
MLGRIVEIAQDGRHLSADRGHMVIAEKGAEIGRLALDDIAAVITSAHGLSYSNNLLVALAQRNAPFILCTPNFTPVGYLLAVAGNHRQAARMEAQIKASVPMGKRLWKAVVQSKIAQQAAVLAGLGLPTAPLNALIPTVRAGDPGNAEAIAAKRYWPQAFGRDFRRDRSLPGANAMLNYGYTVLRAATARAIMGAGLHPSIGIHHRNEVNPMRLADDLVEPFRPLVDRAVLGLLRDGETDVTPNAKKILVDVLYTDLQTARGVTPVMGAIITLATSLAQVYEGERGELELPLIPKAIFPDAARIAQAGE